jgi:hypothetical protein
LPAVAALLAAGPGAQAKPDGPHDDYARILAELKTGQRVRPGQRISSP